jgi:hypothetical protein
MAVAAGRDALMFGIHPRRLAGIPKVAGTPVSTAGNGTGEWLWESAATASSNLAEKARGFAEIRRLVLAHASGQS